MEQPSQEQSSPIPVPVDTERCWRLLLAASALGRRPAGLPAVATDFELDATGSLRPSAEPASALLRWQAGAGWRCGAGLGAAARDFVGLYLGLCDPLPAAASRIFAHLGQSLDGCIATRTGDACFVTGEENITHLHRMRALCDAVVVGAGTVASDDPQLTTRRVPGANAVRVILDPRGRLGAGHRVFTDGAAPTLLCRGAGLAHPAPAGVETLTLPLHDAAALNPGELVQALAERGLRRLFIEGGGVTVSAFLAAGCLDRLQIAVAPVIVGAGRCGITAPPVDLMADALRPPARLYRMGTDILYDFALDGRAAAESGAAGGGIRRVL